MMRLLLTCWSILLIALVSNAQLQIQFQSVGGAGTTLNQGTNGTNLHSMSVSQIAAFGTGQSNDAGFFVSTIVLPPSTQASAIIFSGLASNQFTVSWTNGSGANRLVLAHAMNAVNAVPAYGATYVTNTAFGLGSQIGTGNYVVYNGSGNSVTVTGLSPSVVYNFQVFEYNGTGLTSAYKTLTSTGNPASQTTLATGATTQTSSLAFSNLSNNTVTLSWTNGNGVNRIIVAQQGTTIVATPSSGQAYNANALFGSGDQVATGNYAVYNGSGNSVAISGLLSNSVYYFKAFEYNGSGATSNYLTSGSGNTAQQLTLTDATVAKAATATTQISFDASWSAVTGATFYSIDVSADGFTTFASGYSNGSVSIISTTVSGLSPGTTYQYQVRANNAAGASANSNAVSVLMIPTTPTAVVASTVTQSSFTANWNTVPGASNYFIDVASDAGFTTIVSGYNNLSVATNSLLVTSLSNGTTYYYRVRSANATGSSPSSNTISQITIPANPIVAATTGISQTSFQVNWASSTGATGYFLDVSTSNTFGSFVTGYNNFSVGNVTSYNVIGLTANQTYYCQLRAANSAGTSGNSNVIIALTIPPTPVAIAASSVFNSGFTANWNALVGLSNYFVDVASDAAFVSILGGYNNFPVTTNLLAVTGLNSGTTYYYRVRSQNSTSSSPSSNIVSQITIPLAPTGLASSSVGSTQFIISWTAASGADSYSVDVSKSGDFSTLISGYNGYSTTGTSAVITGLSPSTAYYYRVRAVNTGGNSPATVGSPPVGTLDASGNSVSLSINVTSQPNLTIASVNGTAKVSAQTTGGFGTVSVMVLYRGITDLKFSSTPLTLSGGNYSFTITSALADSLGVEYYFIATDAVGSGSTAHNFIYNSIDASSGGAIPFSDALNGSTSTYQLFSVPYVITDKNIATVFSSLGAYDKTKWRLFHYQNGKYAEYQNGLTNIDLGSGYWFNATEKVSIKPGAGSVVNSVTQSTPYTLTLAQGWNQLGNPFPFPISWSAVKAANPNTTINSLFTFTSAGYTKTDGFKPWTGAFLWSDNGGNILIPVSAKCKGCRIASSESISPTDLDEDAWQLPINLSFSGREQVSGIGMNPQASLSKDKFDEITVPRFVEYLEMNTYHEEFFDPYFSTDIVPNNRQGRWEFTLSSNQSEGNAILSWDQAAIQNNSSKLALFDRDGAALIDMKSTNQYALTWSEGKKIKILYSKDRDILPEVTLLGQAFPNPFNSSLTIPILLDQNQSYIQIHIYDMLGRKVKTITMEQAKAGSFQLEWDGQNDQGNKIESGLYIYQLHGDKGILSTAKKVIKQ